MPSTMEHESSPRRRLKRAQVTSLCKVAILLQQRQAIDDSTDRTLALVLAAARDKFLPVVDSVQRTSPSTLTRSSANHLGKEREHHGRETELQLLLMRRDVQEFRCFFGVEPAMLDELVSCVDVNFTTYTPYGEQNGSLVLRKKRGAGGRPRAMNTQVRLYILHIYGALVRFGACGVYVCMYACMYECMYVFVHTGNIR
jgi:hypothetical protein